MLVSLYIVLLAFLVDFIPLFIYNRYISAVRESNTDCTGSTHYAVEKKLSEGLFYLNFSMVRQRKPLV